MKIFWVYFLRLIQFNTIESPDSTDTHYMVMTSQLMMSSIGFKEKNSWCCLSKARTNIKIVITLVKCYNSFQIITPPASFLSYNFGRITKLVLKKSGAPDPPVALPLHTTTTFSCFEQIFPLFLVLNKLFHFFLF